jgi:hypothetical protein
MANIYTACENHLKGQCHEIFIIVLVLTTSAANFASGTAGVAVANNGNNIKLLTF